MDPKHQLAEKSTAKAPLFLSEVTKSFGGSTVLNLSELCVRAGEIHALIGQNGSGKSTAIKILAGYHQPDAYEHARSAGQDVQLGSAAAAHQAGWRFVHQDLGLVGALDTVDNFALGVGYDTEFGGRINWRKAEREARDAIDGLGYSFDVRVPVQKLAPVERTVVAVARALRQRGPATTMLVLDEPTATMPGPEVERLLSVARTVAANGTAVLLVSHHLDEVMQAADTVTILRDGKVIESAPVERVSKQHLVQQMTGGLIHERQSARPPKEIESMWPVLSVQGLGGQHVEGFDLDVRPGEVVGISGITGSGREEVGSLIFGSKPRTGEVFMDGRRLAPLSPYEAVKAGLGYVPAHRIVEGVLPGMSIRENITLTNLRPHWRRFRLNRTSEAGEVAELRTKFGIRGGGDEQPIVNLSGGNQQKASLAKWMRTRPNVLILDEPTQGIDVGAQAEVHRLVAESAADGLAVLICSSDEVELAAVCSRVLVLQRGRMVRELVGDDITVSAIVAAALVHTNTTEVTAS